MHLPVDRMRRFNRFYTRYVGALAERYLGSAFSLSESRVLFELAHREAPIASVICEELGLDAGYLSRMLRRFTKQGIVKSTPLRHDARSRKLALTARGRAMFAAIEACQQQILAAKLEVLSAAERRRLTDAMQAIQGILGAPRDDSPAIAIRTTLQPGDLGWVIERHGTLYAREHGWDATFQGVVAETCARFVARFDATRERCWFAERDGETVGCIFLLQRSATVAQLRMLIVDPNARGLGLGKQLVGECVAFARACGYKKIMLWTVDELTAARNIYKGAGFRLVRATPNREFGKMLVDEIWEMRL